MKDPRRPLEPSETSYLLARRIAPPPVQPGPWRQQPGRMSLNPPEVPAGHPRGRMYLQVSEVSELIR